MYHSIPTHSQTTNISRVLFIYLLLCYGKKLDNSTNSKTSDLSESDEEFYSFGDDKTNDINNKTFEKFNEPKHKSLDDEINLIRPVENKSNKHTTNQTKQNKGKNFELEDKQGIFKKESSSSSKKTYIVESPHSSDNDTQVRESVSTRTKRSKREKLKANESDTDTHVGSKIKKHGTKFVKFSDSEDDTCPTCHRRNHNRNTNNHQFYEKIIESHTKKIVRREISSGGNKVVIIKKYTGTFPLSDDSDIGIDIKSDNGIKSKRHTSSRRLTKKGNKDITSISTRRHKEVSENDSEELESEEDIVKFKQDIEDNNSESESEDKKKINGQSRSSSRKEHIEHRDKSSNKKNSDSEKIYKLKSNDRKVKNSSKSSKKSTFRDEFTTQNPERVIIPDNSEHDFISDNSIIKRSHSSNQDEISEPNVLNSDIDKHSDDDLEERLIKLMGHNLKQNNFVTSVNDNHDILSDVISYQVRNDKFVGPSVIYHDKDSNKVPSIHSCKVQTDFDEQNKEHHLYEPTTPEQSISPTAPLEDIVDQEKESVESTNLPQENIELIHDTYHHNNQSELYNTHFNYQNENVDLENIMEGTIITSSIPEVHSEAQEFLEKFKILTLDDSSGYEVNNSQRYQTHITSYSISIIFKDDSKCTEVKFNDQTVWKYDGNDGHPISIYVYLKSYIIFININDSCSYSYNFKKYLQVPDDKENNKPQVSTTYSTDIDNINYYSNYTTPKTSYLDTEHSSTNQILPKDYYDNNGKRFLLVELDIEDKNSNNFFIYRDDERKTTVFIAKNCYLINSIKQTKVSSSSTSSTVSIWNTATYPYSNRVLTTGPDVDNLELNIYLINETCLYYDKIPSYPSLPKTNFNDRTYLLPSEHPTNIKILTTDDSGTKENDYSKYVVIRNDSNMDYLIKPSYKYKFKKDSKCVEFKVDDFSLWKYESEFTKIHPSSIFYHKQLNLVLLEFDFHSYYIYKYNDNTWILAYNYRLRQINIDIKNLITDQYEYKNDINKGTFSYSSKPGFPFNTVRQTKSNIWTANDSSQYAKKVVVKETDTNEKYICILLLNGNLIFYYKNTIDKEWIDITESRLTLTNIIFYGEDDNGYDYEEKSIDHSTFDLDNDLLYFYRFDWNCIKVNYLENILWRYYDNIKNGYPVSLFIKLIDNELFISYSDDKIEKIYTSANQIENKQNTDTKTEQNENSKDRNDDLSLGKNKEEINTSLQNNINLSERIISTQSDQLIVLDITKKESCEEFDYCEDFDKKICTYIAKEGYGFNKIAQKKNVWNLTSKDKVIWEASSDKEYLIKVITKSSDDKSKYMLMLPVLGNFMLYYKENEHIDWKDITSDQISFSDFTFLGKDTSDSKVKELNSKHYEKTSFKFSFGYKFRQGVGCNQIKYKNVILWSHTGDPKDSYPSGLYYALYTKNLRLCFTCIDSPLLRTQIGLDINDPGSICYNKHQDDVKNTITFTAKDQYLFSLVRQDQYIIWKTMDLTDNVEKIFYEGVDKDKKKITIYMGNGENRIFEKYSTNEPWYEITSTGSIIVPSEIKMENDNNIEEIIDTQGPSFSNTVPSVKLIKSKTSQVIEKSFIEYVPSLTPDFNESTSSIPSQLSNTSGSEEQQKSSKDTTPSDTPDEEKSEDQNKTNDNHKESLTTCSNENVPHIHPKSIKIFTEGSNFENDSTKYTLKKYGKFYKFEFKNDVKCTKVICGNTVRFEFGINKPEGILPQELYYNPETDYVYIVLFKTKFVPEYTDIEWSTEIGKKDMKISDSKFKIGVEGCIDPNDTTKFDEKNEGSFVKCEFKDEAKCIYISYDYHLVWKYDTNQNKGKYPKFLYFHKHMKVIFAEFENDVYQFIRFDEDTLSWTSENLEKDQSFDPDNFKVLTPDPKYSSITKINDYDCIEKKTFGSILGYIIKKDVLYFKFKYVNDFVISLYNYDDRPKLKEIYFLLNFKKRLVLLEDKSLYIL